MADGERTDYTPLILIDRACTGGFEFFFDGRPFTFKPGQVELTVYGDVARHLFQHEHTKVWTTDGEFVHRVAVKGAAGFEDYAKKLAHALGEEIADQSPIEIDTTRIEGWDTTGIARGQGITETRNVNIPASELRGRDAAPGGRLAYVEKG